MKVNWINERETLEKLIKEGVSYECIGRKYEVTGGAVKKAAKKLGIKLEQKRKISPNETFNKGKGKTGTCLNCGNEFVWYKSNDKKFCSLKCFHEFKHKQYVEHWKKGDKNGVNGKYGISSAIRTYLFEKYNGKCQLCGWGEKNPVTHKVPLQIHHIDGDYTNNKEENLQLLCPNCHSLTENFMSLNINGRKDRQKYDKA